MDKICVSIFANDYDFSLEVVKKYEFVELRLDEGILDNSQIAEIISSGKKIISTCRSGYISDEKRYEILLSAIKNGTTFIDIEHDFKPELRNKLINKAIESNIKIISSYHNLEHTPNLKDLKSIVSILNENSDIVKIACKVNNQEDLLNVLELYRELLPGKLISIGLGEMGKISRIAGLFLGAPFTYASAGNGLETSEGQIDYETFNQILNELNNS